MSDGKGAMRECCKNSNNLHVTEEKSDMTVRRCSVCNRRHFEVIVDPGKIGLQGARL